ncbi:hypothetical protein UG55_103574 [Frankia sp. EI5c]|uniref:DUF5682 family protein n=1 Tax=Frankia sp. EI5c TaxID=683316 RepID=UPI0007C2BE77|nr:DUF5682 family protein [Frankia sp. EI5c]OAA23636.1 hypothetical protein UG55_103574 [Frankia sp. EI5c]
MTVTYLGVRHHGPGSARAVRAALAELDPDLILVEGPPEGDGALTHLGALTPPVALTAYAVDEPRDAAFWPFADFSPEWQALLYGRQHGIPTRFIDLPFGHDLALRRRATASAPDHGQDPNRAPAAPPISRPITRPAAMPAAMPAPMPGARPAVADDPLGWLAFAAGHDDPERFWEDLVEHRRLDGAGAVDVFAAVAESMAALRAGDADTADTDTDGTDTDGTADGRRNRELLREAHMRLEIRAAGTGAGAAHRIAVICGAWHVPALSGQTGRVTVTADRELLRGVRPVRTATTWVPWTHALLATDSGYGAGITSPGWYHHLWSAPGQVTARWVARVAALLRAADLPASTASAVETVRLAETLAAVRDRAVPGLTELTDAVLAGLCAGDPVPLRVVREQLVVGDVVGAVGPDIPAVPLAADVARAQKRLRLAPSPTERPLRLDLRRPLDRDRSALLHRLRLLDIDWGVPARTGSTGTFAEAWQLAWKPAFALTLVSAARYGATVEDAATSAVAGHIEAATDLAAVTELFEQVVLADLPTALAVVSAGLERRAAATGDVAHLMRALAPLARVRRYGDVRGTSPTLVLGLADSLMTRICAGLPPACVSLDDEAADAMTAAVDDADAAFRLVADPGHLDRWLVAVGVVAAQHGGNPLVAGRCTRLLSDAGRLDPTEVSTRLARALSAARGAPVDAARWLAGFLGQAGSVLARDPALLALVDNWLCGLDEAGFMLALAPLRRAFATFGGHERRMIGERVRAGLPRPAAAAPGAPGLSPTGPAAEEPTGAGIATAITPASAAPGVTGLPGGPPGGVGAGPGWDLDRVAVALPALTTLLGLTTAGPCLATAGKDDSDAR